MAYRVGLIADDLTGALDVAAPFAQRGLRTRVVCRLEALDEMAGQPCDVLSVNTGSRHLAADEAVRAVERVCRFFTGQQVERLYKKIDSTLRGNTVAEIVAALNAGDRRQAIVTPALPAQGRTLHNGELYVNGVPLRDTAVMRDPVAAPDVRPLAEQLKEYAPKLMISSGVDEPAWSADTRQVWIADCADEAAIARIARAALAHDAATMMTAGSAGLADGLAAAAFGRRRPLNTAGLGAGTVLFVVGSRAPASVTQAEQLAASAECMLIEAPAGHVDIESALRVLNDRPAVALIRVPAQPAAQPLQVAAQLGAGIAALLERLTPAALICTGGDTAPAILDALNQPLLELGGELLSGIPLSFFDCNGRSLPLITKAGGFGDDRVFLETIELLR